MKIKYLLPLILLSTSAMSESLPPSDDIFVKEQSSSAAGFTYPDITITESDVTTNDVLFFYSEDMLDFFGNDVENIVKYVNESVALNNKSLWRQNIPLRRKVSGLQPFPVQYGYDDKASKDDRLVKLRQIYNNNTYKFNYFYESSYIVALNRYYKDIVPSVGLGELGGKYSWISPYELDKPERTFGHEVGHNDGFTHNEDTANANQSNGTPTKSFLARDYAVGDTCGNYDSIMQSSNGNRDEAFFSSPLVTDPQGNECGRNEVSDAARAYRDAVDDNLKRGVAPFANNIPSKPKTGTVSLSVPNTTVTEGMAFPVEIIWSGAEHGDVVQIITKKGTAGLSDFRSKLYTAYFDEAKAINTVSIETLDDNDFELDETFTVELIYPHGVAIDESAYSQAITLISDDAGNAGTFEFSQTAISANENSSVQLIINRAGGTDGQFSVFVKTEAGTADENDYAALDREIVFSNGEVSKTITLSIKSDSTNETSETFSVNLTGDTSIIGTKNKVNVTINASTPPPSNNGGGGSFGIIMLLFALAAMSRKKQA